MTDETTSKVLGVLAEGPKTRRELEDATGLSLKTVLPNLKREGLISSIGQKRGTRYMLGATDEA